MITIDTREPKDLRVALILAAGATLDVDVACLKLGDYHIVCGGPLPRDYLIERKTIRDFLSSWGDGRLDHQMRMLSEHPGKRILLLEGTWSTSGEFIKIPTMRKPTGWRVSSFARKLISLQEQGLQLLYTPSKETTIAILIALSGRPSPRISMIGRDPSTTNDLKSTETRSTP